MLFIKRILNSTTQREDKELQFTTRSILNKHAKHDPSHGLTPFSTNLPLSTTDTKPNPIKYKKLHVKAED